VKIVSRRQGARTLKAGGKNCQFGSSKSPTLVSKKFKGHECLLMREKSLFSGAEQNF
jgi:hypothetical protein